MKQGAKKIRLLTDGKWPSLALLRLSAMHEKRGDQVVFGAPTLWEPWRGDLVYRSSIFRSDRNSCDIEGGPASEDPSSGVESVGCREPAWQEQGGITYGYTTRGCPNRCPWCIAWKAEGTETMSLGYVGHAEKAMILDANFFGADDWRARVALLKSRVGILSICQGVNLKTITRPQAEALVDLAPLDTKLKKKAIYCALDKSADMERFERGLQYCREAGWPKWEFRPYMLLKPEDDLDDAYRRYRFLRDLDLIFIFPQVWHKDGQCLPVLERFQHYVIARDHDVDRQEKELREMERREKECVR